LLFEQHPLLHTCLHIGLQTFRLHSLQALPLDEARASGPARTNPDTTSNSIFFIKKYYDG